jgi:hypothetical protein
MGMDTRDAAHSGTNQPPYGGSCPYDHWGNEYHVAIVRACDKCEI